MVDTLGLVMMVVLTAAHMSDPQGARLIFARLAALPQWIARLSLIWSVTSLLKVKSAVAIARRFKISLVRTPTLEAVTLIKPPALLEVSNLALSNSLVAA